MKVRHAHTDTHRHSHTQSHTWTHNLRQTHWPSCLVLSPHTRPPVGHLCSWWPCQRSGGSLTTSPTRPLTRPCRPAPASANHLLHTPGSKHTHTDMSKTYTHILTWGETTTSCRSMLLYSILQLSGLNIGRGTASVCLMSRWYSWSDQEN